MKHRLSILLLGFLFAGTFAFAQEGNNSQDPDEKDIIVQDFLDKANRIDIYPNPAQEYLIVQITNSNVQDLKFEIRSLLGQEMIVVPEDLGNGKYRFPVKDFAVGYYFVIVKDTQGIINVANKFLKTN